ncbi:nephrin-like [Tubulanus polymorphus]|uniref:nephrin-like n=1 Tax=Tubulanus polymorphus TaxID=672921 RepID=UPI003DA5E41E
MSRRLVIVVINLGILSIVFGQLQRFRKKPVDQQVREGSSTVLRCDIENRAGNVQWAKDGFVLGYNPSVPGYPQYRYIGDFSSGEYNLEITNIGISDDAVFSCQVSPGEGNPPLMALAQLSVLVPPSPPVISGQKNGSVIEVPPVQRVLDLVCEAKNGKPAAEIVWVRNGVPVAEEVKYSVQENQDGKRQDARSVLTIRPHKEDNGVTYACRAINAALDRPLQTMVTLSVLHVPGPPVITGYEEGFVLRTGDTLILLCTSKGGNPLGTVIWYRNGKEIDYSYVSGSDKSVNELHVDLTPKDNDAIYTCEVKNVVTPIAMTTQVKLTVQFAPAITQITGHTNAKAGEMIKLKCDSAISNPASVITWFAKGRQLQHDKQIQTPSPHGGFTTHSEITIKLVNTLNNVIYTCQATNHALGQTVADTVTLSVLYPPQPPVISGYTGQPIIAGHIHQMTCVSVGGNPIAELTWWKGNEPMQSVRNKVDGNVPSSVLRIIAQESDNEAEYRCNASNKATTDPLSTTIKLKVRFPPKNLSIKVLQPSNGRIPRAGRRMKLQCDSASSNPPADITWKRAGGKRVGGQENSTLPGIHGGKCARSVFIFRPTAKDDNTIVSCQATNSLLQQSTHEGLLIRVRYAPRWKDDVPPSVTVTEGQQYILNLTAHSNPPVTSYKWYKDGEELTQVNEERRRKRNTGIRFTVSDGVLNMTNVKREDSGVYVLIAKNDEGQGNFTFSIDVQYAARISTISNPVYANSGADAIFECAVDANPKNDKMISWSREGFDTSRMSVIQSDEGKSVMKLTKVTKADSGEFLCTVTNGIGKAHVKEAELIVKYAPVVDKAQRFTKAAAARSHTGVIPCLANGAPNIDFIWKKGDEVLKTEGRYSILSDQMDKINYKSVLTIANITRADYGKYQCIAKNDLGEDKLVVMFDGTSRPDPPMFLKVLNSTYNSLTIQWVPGFDGGLAQTFRVRYLQEGELGYKYSDIHPPTDFTYHITDLKLGTEYSISMKAINNLGSSDYSTQVKSRTSTEIPKDEQLTSTADEVPMLIILVICAVALVLLGLNVLLILYLVRRRNRRLMAKGSGPELDGDNHVNTLELYSSPAVNYISNTKPQDSKTYSSYDQSLDDFNDDLYKSYREDETYPLNKSGPYSPVRSDVSSDSPNASLINKKSTKTYIDDNVVGNSNNGWSKEGNNYNNKTMSLPRQPGGYGKYSNDAYSETLRRNTFQQHLDNGRVPQKTQPNGHSTTGRNGKTPPPPPVRSSSSSSQPNTLPRQPASGRRHPEVNGNYYRPPAAVAPSMKLKVDSMAGVLV